MKTLLNILSRVLDILDEITKEGAPVETFYFSKRSN